MKNTATHQSEPQDLNNVICNTLLIRRDRLQNNLDKFFATDQADRATQRDRVEDICNTLVDYLATGHFKLFPEILGLQDQEFQAAQQLLLDYYPVIERTTRIGLEFTDRNNSTCYLTDSGVIDFDLSALEDALQQRFQAEEMLISRLNDSRLNIKCNKRFSTTLN